MQKLFILFLLTLFTSCSHENVSSNINRELAAESSRWPAQESASNCLDIIQNFVKGSDHNGPTEIRLVFPTTSGPKSIFKKNKSPEIIRENIEKTVNTFSPYLKMPELLTLEITPNRDIFEAAFNPSSRTISTGETIIIQSPTNRERQYALHPNITRDINNHEFGHAIFTENISEERIEIKEIFLVLTKLDGLYNEERALEEKLILITKKLSDTINPDVLSAKNKELSTIFERSKREMAYYIWLEQEVKSSDQEIISNKQKLKSLITKLTQVQEDKELYTAEKYSAKIQKSISYFESLLIYNEFFADVTAVLMAEKPNIISSGSHFNMNFYSKNKTDDKAIGVLNKQFKQINKQASYRQFVDTTHVTGVPETPHGELWIARQFLWDEYLSHPTLMKTKKGEILTGVFKAIVRSSDALNVQQDTMKNLSKAAQIAQVNETFILYLKEELPN